MEGSENLQCSSNTISGCITDVSGEAQPRREFLDFIFSVCPTFCMGHNLCLKKKVGLGGGLSVFMNLQS